MESPSTGSYHPTQSPNQHNNSNHQPVPTHTTQPSPAPSGSEEWAKLLVTCMEDQEYNNREIENRKTYLENIKVYEGTDKQKCLPWVNQLQQAAKCSNTSLRAALLARAGATVFGIVAATPENIDDLEMKKVVLRNFSDTATPTEAAQKLRNMRMTSDQCHSFIQLQLCSSTQSCIRHPPIRTENEVCTRRLCKLTTRVHCR